MTLPTATPREYVDDPGMRRAELVISRVLRIGVIASILVVVAGSLLTFVRHREYVSSPAELDRLTRPGSALPQTLGSVLHGVVQLQGPSVVAAGLLLLMLTPVMRVATSVVLFAAQRDRAYVLITSVVLLLLVLSFLLGRAVA